LSFGSYGRLVLVSLVLGFTVWPQMARYVRGQTLQLKEQQFIEAAHTNGTSSTKIILRHILPNIASLIVVAATLDMATTVVSEGVLSLLGLGAQPPGSSLGLMVVQYTNFIQSFGYEIIWPMAGIVILVLALSFLGDGLRDAFDPRTKD
jgi:peptide/nickel transport system permease protein